MVQLAEGGSRLDALADGARTSADARVYILDCVDTAAHDWGGAVEAPSRALLGHLSRVAGGDDVRSVTVVVKTGGDQPVLATAAVEAVRGVVGAAALELGSVGVRVNAVVLDDTVSDADIVTTVGYLTDDVAAGYTTGATISLHTPAYLRSTVPAGADAHGVALVTGGAGGIGRAAAVSFQRAGHDVVLTDLPGDALDRAAEELGVPALPCDVAEPPALDRLAGEALLRDGVAVLVVHHGVPASTRLASLDSAVADRSLTVNGTAVASLVDRFTPLLRLGDPGTVVALSSQAGLVAEPGNSAYCAAKFAVVGLVRAVAPQLAVEGVRIQAICPGAIDTPLLRRAFEGFAADLGISDEEFTAQRVAGMALGRIGRPAEIGASSLFLSRLQATGVVLAPTGGEVLT